MDFCHSQVIHPTNTRKKLLNTSTKTGLDAAETASKKLVHKTAEAPGELIGSKIREKVVKLKSVLELNSRNVEEIVISQGKIPKLLNNSTVIKVCNKK